MDVWNCRFLGISLDFFFFPLPLCFSLKHAVQDDWRPGARVCTANLWATCTPGGSEITVAKHRIRMELMSMGLYMFIPVDIWLIYGLIYQLISLSEWFMSIPVDTLGFLPFCKTTRRLVSQLCRGFFALRNIPWLCRVVKAGSWLCSCWVVEAPGGLHTMGTA